MDERLTRQQASRGAKLDPIVDPPVFNPAIHSLEGDPHEPDKDISTSNIRLKLKEWNDKYGHMEALDSSEEATDVNEFGEASNNFTRLGDGDNFRKPQEAIENERDDLALIAQARADELEDFDPHHRFLRKGDLVELEFPRSERESIIAVYIRSVGTSPPQSQFYTINGKWIHVNERQIQFAVPGWMDPTMIDPIIPYLPDQEVTEELLDRAQMFDLSVPRFVSAPLVSRMLEFQRQSEETYRKYATTLDNAHNLLAHPTDLKFGSLEQVALKLLSKESKNRKLLAPALFTVRKALKRGGFAFGSDKRSHRLTGFVQIRSKEQVATLEKVRSWLREWQDQVAAASNEPKKSTLGFTGRAKGVNDFIVKARQLIRESRQKREATQHGRVAPSKVRFELSSDQEIVRSYHTLEFSETDRDLIRFMEGWACSNMFLDLPRVEALPPLLLQATGFYEEHPLNTTTGYLFLQEIGVIVPHENRVRFDQHLLLPHSQHSKPLEQLMETVMDMSTKPEFVDSMREIRKDWGDLPVFCIDQEGAHEIDDGLSLEKAEGDRYWLHIHIANPTAHFSRDSPLAKMARHMTESIYMPERAFMMLPRWAAGTHFSLDKNRPCLTFSAKLDPSGETLEHKITPGFIRNVRLISPQEISKVIGLEDSSGEDVSITVGGEVPTLKANKTADSLSAEHIETLKKMQRLAERLQAKRKAAGGIFLDSHRPDITVWSNLKGPGLRPEHPSRYTARYTEGEPIIQYRSKKLVSWFSAGEGVSDILVRESMLLACKIGASWCAERNIPIIYRGTVRHPHTEDPEMYYKNVLAPATEKNGGEAPMHLAVEYLRSTGATILATTPLHHRVLGLDHYGKVTSPLRRYGDMITHWQIEAALREEARTKKSLIGSKREEYLPFSTSNLKQITTGLQPREMIIRRASRYAEDFWVAQLFFRAFHYGECPLPSKFSAYIFQQPQSQVNEVAIVVEEYTLTCTMTKPQTLGLGDAKAGDWWEVEISHVDCFQRKVVMNPTRLISRWE